MPQNLSATAVSSSQIDLTWDASTDNVAVAGYRIYRDNVLVHTSATNSYSDTGLDPATEYEYEVSAIDAASNESARSTPDSATTQSAGDTEAPSVPQNLSATAVSSSQIDLSWNASTDNVAVTGYNIYRDNVLIDTSASNAYSDTSLPPGTYTYEVSAVDAASNESGRSNMASATVPLPDTQAPSVPQNLVATAVSSSQINLSWNASTDNVAVTGYKIYRDNVLINTSPTSSYSDTGLAPGTLYQYEVSAFDAASNESARSAPASATTHQVIVTAGLIAEWRFDEGTGQIVNDHSGNGFHATLGSNDTVQAGEPTWASYGVDCVLSQAQNWINTNSNLGLAGGVARTVICVAQINDSLGQGAGFGSWNSGGVAANRWWFTPQTGSPANLQLTVGSGSANFVFSSLNPMPFNTWMFLACTQSGANLNTCVGYRDGVSQASTQSATINAAGNFEMMSRGNSSGVNKWGKVAYQLVYNRALSAPEIAQNRQALKDILAGRGITLP